MKYLNNCRKNKLNDEARKTNETEEPKIEFVEINTTNNEFVPEVFYLYLFFMCVIYVLILVGNKTRNQRRRSRKSR